MFSFLTGMIRLLDSSLNNGIDLLFGIVVFFLINNESSMQMYFSLLS